MAGLALKAQLKDLGAGFRERRPPFPPSIDGFRNAPLNRLGVLLDLAHLAAQGKNSRAHDFFRNLKNVRTHARAN